LVEGTPDLGLEEHDDADQDRRRRIAEDPGQQPQVEQGGEEPDQAEEQDADHQLHRLGAADQQEHPVEEDRNETDVDQVEGVPPDVPTGQEDQDVPEHDVHSG